MPKRLANCRGFTTARFGRIRIGYWKSRMLSQVEKMDELDRMGELDDTAKQKFAELKVRVKQVIPKVFLRRHQGR